MTEDTRRAGFAPGDYLCTCSECNGQFAGDKRAIRCQSCATLVIRAVDLAAALRSIINHWNEFGGMMGIKDDYGMGERMDAAEKLIR